MGKQLTILFWGFIYGEVFGYIVSALTGSTFNAKLSGLIPMIAGFIIINCLSYFVKDTASTKKI
ncbi:YjzD family protein [Ligilactobacillus sp. WILCCON 0076]|uniref:YjzD family protein n=1 Tax=Ligilactobacillus ubinensis TaxID=2876789 RepID=A0A9X2FK23_9LACO|nr:YjzD family protein [Ligilactobacillus ubinensis]MCP0886176.1 YjzD family protein [Ligilactobacillus ubinensis]